ncbi:MAG TPA: autotransporter domain-containing protein [Dongiaceae bacterium]|nr:autotransporter domain-containing protein [Dongiaceae bacterium]
MSVRPACRRILRLAAALLVAASPAWADDVNVTADTNDGVGLDGFAGTTVRVLPGVTVTDTNGTANCGSQPALCATTKSWSLSNDGTIDGSATGAGVRFDLGGSVVNTGDIKGTNIIDITGGTASVTNQLGATMEGTVGGINIADPGAQFVGTVINHGTITGGTFADGVALYGGGSVTNTGTISDASGSNAVSISGGTTRTVTNSGTISNTGGSFATGVLIQGAGAVNTITNNPGGQIIGGYNGVYASATAALDLDNAGSISSTRGPAIEATAGGTFNNSGTIGSANSDGIFVRNSFSAEVINSGTIGGSANAINFASGGGVGAAHTLRLQTGSILNGNVLGGSGADGLILEGSGSESLAKFSNFETLTMDGGTWIVSGAGAFSTGTTVQSGNLKVNGTLTSPLTVDLGGTLSGIGTIVGAVTNNGNIAPGNSIGTMNLAGPYIQAGGSTYTVELDTSGASDLINVTGAATIQPGATVSVQAAPGTYMIGTRSTILTASGGVTGTYDTLIDNRPFVDFVLDYDANNVFLDVLSISSAFSTVARTPNQRAAAGGLDTVDPGNAAFTAALSLDAAAALNAFDQLSGEIYATEKGVLLNQSADIRDALNARTRDSFDTVPNGVGPSQFTFNLAPQPGADCGIVLCAIGDRPILTGWGRAFGDWAGVDGDGNAAAADSETGGFLAGFDATFQRKWRIGFAGGYSHTGIDVESRNSTAAIDSYHLGLYGGFRQGSFAARLGGGYAFNEIAAERDIDFAGFSDSTHADYAARTAQVFGEVSNDFTFGAVTLSPFAGLAYVNLDSDGFREHGGDAALKAGGRDSDLGFSSLGLRGATAFDAFAGTLKLHGMVGWRHALGDTTPESALSFVAGSDSFTVSGVPVARDAALVDLGIDLDLTDRLTIGLSYSGQIADDARENGIRGDIRFSF